MSLPDNESRFHESFGMNGHKTQRKNADKSADYDQAELLIPKLDKWPEALVRGLGLTDQLSESETGEILPAKLPVDSSSSEEDVFMP